MATSPFAAALFKGVCPTAFGSAKLARGTPISSNRFAVRTSPPAAHQCATLQPVFAFL